MSQTRNKTQNKTKAGGKKTAAKNGAQNFQFETEVRQLLKLMIHSLYTHKEVFLRELISNASDACDKLRFAALTDGALKSEAGEPLIRIRHDEKQRTISVSDNGIGMSRGEVMENIGTIARSGTKRFVEAAQAQKGDDLSLIGQFGVGFYSAFMVAEKVELWTRRAGGKAAEAVKWSSDGEGYTMENARRERHGTEVVLHLRREEKEFLNGGRLRDIIARYSDHISIPIEMPAPGGDGEWEEVNKGAALWTRPRREISAREYDNFYAALSMDAQPPAAVVHNRVEGRMDYISLFFIPAAARFNMFDPEERRGVKLYVRRIFILEDSRLLLPRYLRFVRGVVDAADLPLNVSREFLQHDRGIDTMRKACAKRILAELKRIADKDAEKYQALWNEYGAALKEGLVEDPDNAPLLLELARFATTAGDSAEQKVSLAEYARRMPFHQKAVYYITAQSHAAAQGSPHLEIFRKKNIEVLLLSDAVDEWLVAYVPKFQDRPLKSVAHGEVDLVGGGDKGAAGDNVLAPEVLAKLKDLLGGKVKAVTASSRLTDSPACLVAGEHDVGGNMKRILGQLGQQPPDSKPIMELNPAHPLVKQLGVDNADLADWAEVLFSQAALSEGAALAEPAEYVRKVNALLTRGVLRG